MRSSTFVRWFAVAGAASVLLTACTHGDKGDAKSSTKRVTMASIMGASEDVNVDDDALRQQTEEAVATCMIGEGWQYIPVTYPETNSNVEYTDEDEVARIKREGLGVAYELLNQGTATDPWAGFVDPNQKYLETLTDAARQAYEAALSGTSEEQAAISTTWIDPKTGAENEVSAGNILGCHGEAYREVWGVDVTSSPKYWVTMQAYYDEVQQRVQADPRMVKFNEEWSACMNKSGFDYANDKEFLDKAYQDFQTQADAVLGPDFYSKDPTDGWTQDKIDQFWASASQDQIDALYNQARELTADQRTQLEAILADEVTVGLAEHACSQDLNARGPDISAEIEAAYALEHEDELKALAATLQAQYDEVVGK